MKLLAMDSQTYQSHFVLIPYMTPGHLIPMIDVAKLLAQRNVLVSIVLTPLNVARFSNVIDRSIQAGLPIQALEVKFPSVEVGLPEGCESPETLPSRDLIKNFFRATDLLPERVEKLFEQLKPSPSCMVADKNFPWTADIAAKFQIPFRVIFDGMSSFSQLCFHTLQESKVYEKVSEFEPLVIPGLPDKIELTTNKLPGEFNPGLSEDFKALGRKMREGQVGAYGVIVNSFEELEPDYVEGYQKATGKKLWCVGPVSLCNKDDLDKAERGDKASNDVNQCLKWLDSWPANSVIYVCLGSLNGFTLAQLIELGLGLEATNRPFVWVIRGEMKREIQKWLEEDEFEKRVKERGLVILGWAPQVLILSHPAIGAFLTHCGWNSTLEGICAGVPLVTWPLSAEQFINETLITQVLKIGVPLGSDVMVPFGQEEKFGVLVKKEKIREVVDKAMNEDQGEEINKRAKRLAEMAKKAVEEGGSSYNNITLLTEDIIQQARGHS